MTAARAALPLLLAIALATPARADRKRASEHFALAEAAERRKDWRAAIAEYERSYAAEPHPAMLYNIARNHERLDEPRAAAEHYRRYLDESGDAADRDVVEERMRALRERPSQVSIVAEPPGVAVFVDGKRVGDAPHALALDPGSHEIYVAHQGRTSRIEEIVCEYGEPRTVRFDLEGRSGYLVIASNVDGAEVVLDGELLGRTPYQGAVPTGKHLLVVTHPGWQSAQRELSVHAGGSEQIRVDLSKDPTAPPEPEPPRPARWLFGIGYGYEAADSGTRYTLGVGVRGASERAEASVYLAIGSTDAGVGVESRLFLSTRALRPFVRAAAVTLKDSRTTDGNQMLALEGGAGFLYSMRTPVYQLDYYLEVDVQGIVAGLPSEDDGAMTEDALSRVRVPVSAGVIWVFGGRTPQR